MDNLVTGPLVSVIIPSFNGDKYLDEAIQSVLAQTYKNYELIVVDDGSPSDVVAKVCDRYKDKINYIRQKNLGQAAARNTGIKAARGEYLAFLDDDDMWMPEKLEKQVALYEELRRKGVSAGLIYTGHEYITEDKRLISRTLYKSAGRNFRTLVFKDFVGTPSSVMIHKNVFENVGLFSTGLENTEDFDLWLRIGARYEIYSLNEFLIQYRNKYVSASKNVEKKIKSTERVISEVLRYGCAMGLIEKTLEPAIRAHYKKVAALRWKNSAYESLFHLSNAAAFRRSIRKGFAIDRTCFCFKVAIFYALSFVSPGLCIFLRRFKKEMPQTTIVDVNSLRFD